LPVVCIIAIKYGKVIATNFETVSTLHSLPYTAFTTTKQTRQVAVHVVLSSRS